LYDTNGSHGHSFSDNNFASKTNFDLRLCPENPCSQGEPRNKGQPRSKQTVHNKGNNVVPMDGMESKDTPRMSLSHFFNLESIPPPSAPSLPASPIAPSPAGSGTVTPHNNRYAGVGRSRSLGQRHKSSSLKPRISGGFYSDFYKAPSVRSAKQKKSNHEKDAEFTPYVDMVSVNGSNDEKEHKSASLRSYASNDLLMEEDALPNPIRQVREQYDRDFYRMLRYRHGTADVSWISATNTYKTYIDHPDPNQPSFVSLSTENKAQIGIACLNVSVSGGSWYFECRIRQTASFIALGWMIEDSFKELDGSFILKAYAIGTSERYDFVKKIIQFEKQPYVLLGIAFNNYLVEFYCNGELFYQEELEHKDMRLNPFVLSEDRAFLFSTVFWKDLWEFSCEEHMPLLSTIIQECPETLFSESIMIPQQEHPLKFHDIAIPKAEEVYLRIFKMCYSQESNSIIQSLHSGFTGIDVEIFRYCLHSHLHEFILFVETEKNFSSSDLSKTTKNPLFLRMYTFLCAALRKESLKTEIVNHFIDGLTHRMESVSKSPPLLVRYLCALRMPVLEENDSQLISKYRVLKEVFAQFFDIAQTAVMTIVNELSAVYKTISRISSIGGVAGGSKYIHQ
jgi:hypothetical protein